MKDVLPSCFPLADALLCRPVEGAQELAQHLRIRRAVFVGEQGLFDRDDRDDRDDDPATVHVLGLVDGLAAGTVRLYPLAGAVWKGDRLAVLHAQRQAGLGGPLVRRAVELATARGGARMDATVQAVHTDFFLALGWTRVGAPAAHLGVPHQAMTIALR